MTYDSLTRNFLIRTILLCLFIAISIDIQAVIIYVVNSESRTLSRIDTDTNQVQNSFATLGIVPNKVISAGNFLWCVNSGDNALQKINPETGSTISNILIESGCNPWDVCYDDGYLYVSGLFTNKVYKVNTLTDAVEGSIEVGISPEALCTYGDKLYVTNTGGYQNNYANSSVSVIDLNAFEVITTIPVSANPQYIVEKNGLLHVSCTGNWFDVLGKVAVINPATDELVQTLDIGGSLGGLWVKNTEQAFTADGNGLNLYQYNPESFAVINDASSPITPGGSVVWGNNELIALLSPNWGNNGKIRILHSDLSFWKEYNVGMAPTDMKFQSASTPVNDDTALPHPLVTVYPNPAYSGQDITFKFAKAIKGNLKIYNAKGQLVLSKPILSDKTTIIQSSYNTINSNGIFFYSLEAGNNNIKGKFIILR